MNFDFTDIIVYNIYPYCDNDDRFNLTLHNKRLSKILYDIYPHDKSIIKVIKSY